MRLLFFGCDDFAAVSLSRLIDDGHRVVGLVTQPDRPRGRGMHTVYSATKEVALVHGIEVYQPVTLRDPAVYARFRSFEADLFVVIAYGKILPMEVLAMPRYYCVNLHGSLLPAWRGAAPVNWAVIRGDKVTGVTLMRMNELMDGGEIIETVSCLIGEDQTSAELRSCLADLGADLLSRTLPRIKARTVTFTAQDPVKATLAPKMHKDLGHIRWDMTASEIHDLVRGVQPWPGAFTFWRGLRIKVLEASADICSRRGQPGEIVDVHKDGFLVQAADSAVLVRRVHPESSKPMAARAFLAGHKLSPGDVLG